MKILDGLGYIPLIDWFIILVLVLILLAVVYLLRRNQDQKEPSQTPRWLVALRLIGFGVFSLVLISLVLMVVKNYQGMLVETRPTPSHVKIPKNLSFDVEEIHFPSEGELDIAGWFVAPQNNATIILLHGYGGNRTGSIWYAEVLTEAGYGVLMYDERASGESEGQYRSFGWEDAADVDAALVYLENRSDVDLTNIGIAGCSMGGQIALQGAAYYPQIDAVWADGPSVIRAVDSPPPHNWAQGLGYISTFIIDWMYEWYLKIEAPPAMVEIIANIAPRPVMLIAGGESLSYFGSEEPRMYFYAKHAGENAEVWVIEEAYHCDGPQRRPEEYSDRMVEFFNQAFGFQPDQ